jgi:ribonuclease-3
MDGRSQALFYEALERRLEHSFKNPQIIAQALTHRSHGANHNERLEFLGDSVLNLAVSQMLFKALADLPEGDLSRVRANLVKQDTLYKLALDLGLSGLIKLGEGEMRSGGQKRPSILADALEAVIGAVFVDAGYNAAEALVFRLFDQVSINPNMSAASKDPKTELQEWLQAKRFKLPIYSVVGTSGAAHQQTFEVQCQVVELKVSESGVGDSKRAAEQAAASAVLERLREHQDAEQNKE